MAGKVTSYIDYDAWGEPTDKAILKLGVRELDLVTEYTGHPYDAVLGVYYAKARMYDAADKRFMAKDPVKGTILNPQTLVPYTYVLNNPLKYTDPTGTIVSDWDQAHLTPAEQAQVEDLGRQWNEANARGDRAAMDAAHDAAEAIREPYRSGTEHGTAEGYTVGTPASNTPSDPAPGDNNPTPADPPPQSLVDFQAAVDEVNSMSPDELLDYAVDLGIMSQETANAIKSLDESQKAQATSSLKQAVIFKIASDMIDSYTNPDTPTAPVAYGPGHLFATMDEAAIDFALTYNAQSIGDKQEYGSTIYKVKTKDGTFYTYTEPNKGGESGVFASFKIAELPNTIAFVHTHSNYDPNFDNENFSTGFAMDTGTATFLGIFTGIDTMYVVTPGGSVKVYDYKTDKTYIVYWDAPRDPNSPDTYKHPVSDFAYAG